ncbi:hypothetical protein LEMLEM_LOCUS333 [Lemmus lemmus]
MWSFTSIPCLHLSSVGAALSRSVVGVQFFLETGGCTRSCGPLLPKVPWFTHPFFPSSFPAVVVGLAKVSFHSCSPGFLLLACGLRWLDAVSIATTA